LGVVLVAGEPCIGDDTEDVEFGPADVHARTMDVVGRTFEATTSR
jgi:hypothetical protein